MAKSRASTGIEIRGLRDFRREIAKVDRSFSNEMRKVHRRVADLIADRSRQSMRSGNRQASAASGAIKPRASNSSAKIETVNKPAFALGTIWGQRRRSGWYARPQYAASAGKQFPAWVGNQWDPGEAGGKPYHIGPAINQSLDDVDRIYLEGIDDIARRAFPD